MKFKAADSSPCIFEDNVVSAGRQPGASIMVLHRPELTYAGKRILTAIRIAPEAPSPP